MHCVRPSVRSSVRPPVSVSWRLCDGIRYIDLVEARSQLRTHRLGMLVLPTVLSNRKTSCESCK